MSQTRVPCNCSKCGLAFAVVYEIEKPGPLTWKTVACPGRNCKNMVRFPIPQNASFVLDAPAADHGGQPASGEPARVAPVPSASPSAPEPAALTGAPPAPGTPERSEAQACGSCGHTFTLRYKYLDADAESVTWVQCPNCGSSLQVWVLEGAHDFQV